jgi:hypothetical protein
LRRRRRIRMRKIKQKEEKEKFSSLPGCCAVSTAKYLEVSDNPPS